IHNNCEATDFHQLAATVGRLVNEYGDLLEQLQWLNLGGGYYIQDLAQLEVLIHIVNSLRNQFGLEIFFEPGKGIVGQAGYLVAGVIDLFDSGGKTVAILDTTVNHLP